MNILRKIFATVARPGGGDCNLHAACASRTASRFAGQPAVSPISNRSVVPGSNAPVGSAACRFGNLRDSRLGSLRHIKAAASRPLPLKTISAHKVRVPGATRRTAGFTMVEIAICLAVVGFALVAIMHVLPIGMHVQQNNREETIINQDASVILESIRNGVSSGSDLTNYVYAITNYVTRYSPSMQVLSSNVNGYTYRGSTINGVGSRFGLTNNARIIGLLSTPEFLTVNGNNSFTPTNNLYRGGISNHVYAYVHSLSGPAVEKPPQNNDLLVGDSFTYRLLCVNAPVAMDTNLLALTAGPTDQQIFTRLLAVNLHELRLTFVWPVLPNSSIGVGGPPALTQRTLIAGGITETNDSGQQWLYYYQPQAFNNVP